MKYITTGEAARLCGVGINTVKRWIQKGQLKSVVTPGGHWRIKESDFSQFLHAHNMTPLQSGQQPHKVLLIEDDQSMCSLIEGTLDLAASAIEFDYACDGYTGLMKLGVMQPDLLILDIMLPEINRLELMRRIRVNESFSDMRILVITGAGDRRIVRRALEQSSQDALIFKPFATSDLLQRIEQLLNIHPQPVSSSL